MADRNKLNDPARSPLGGHPQPAPNRTDAALQADPELVEGPASGSRILAFGVAIVVVLGAVFYGLNTTSNPPDGTSATATQSTPVASPQTPNSAPGTTTGVAPANPQQPKSGPTGTEVDRSKGGSN